MEEDGPSDKQDDGIKDNNEVEPREAVQSEKSAQEEEKGKQQKEKIWYPCPGDVR